ncbi:MAG: cation:dicarboxylase symporter family transporter [Gemmatimonadales bacterium]|nr:cation:dicarboxylase symporter family transporter [Gemmatimonadales bacterium]NIN12890.1 cation:dicarboxylase symporter family transporter [Gemmatimonadales bacterium]NIR00177.1 cation:dicarboxylase symporter family transporter [Gemmatimonadales bacterium]NIS65970.1 cation:dicarboxylase symporter family transporter [Gemmatimonadales bacterium]
MKLHIAIALGLIGGLLLGLVASVTGSPALMWIAEGVEPLGTAFVNLMKMVVIPLVASVIFVGVCTLGDLRQLGRLGGLTLLFFAATTVVSVLMGMGVMRAMVPLASEAAAQAVAPAAAEAQELPGPIEFLLSLIPSNPFQVATEGALLPLIVFVILVAAATGALPESDRGRLLTLASAVAAALIKLVHWIMVIAPVGVFGLAAPVTARAGWAMLQSLAIYVIAVLVGLLIFISVIYVPVVKFLARMPMRRFLRGCLSPQIIAAATVSSPATVPAMFEAADQEFRVSRPVSGFVIPLGAGIGRAGAALFQGAGVVYLAWLYGVPLAVSGIGGAVLAVFIVSFTVPSIPGGSVVSLAPALGTIGIPLDGMAVLLGVDRIPDMARTATNVTGTLTATVLMDRLEGSRGAIPNN